MKLMEFDYTKSTGEVTKRALVVMQEPNKNLSGYDVSELTEDEFADFISAYRELKNRQYQEFQSMIIEHDLKHKYRQFIPEKITNLEINFL